MDHAQPIASEDATQVVAIVQRVVGALAPLPTEQVRPEDQLIDDLGYHSLRLVELSSVLEELFGLEPVTLEDAPPIRSVAELSDFLLARLVAGEAAIPAAAVVEQYLDYR